MGITKIFGQAPESYYLNLFMFKLLDRFRKLANKVSQAFWVALSTNNERERERERERDVFCSKLTLIKKKTISETKSDPSSLDWRYYIHIYQNYFN